MMVENKKKAREAPRAAKAAVVIGTVVVLVGIRLVAAFPVVNYNGNDIRLFSAELLVGQNPIPTQRPQEQFFGRVIGTHVLETEFGQITLKNSARIRSKYNDVDYIGAENFEEGRASHNLVVDGIELQPNITVYLSGGEIYALKFDRQDVTFSGVPLRLYEISINSPDRINTTQGDIVLLVGQEQGSYITLADSTQIYRHDTNSSAVLHIYKNSEYWRWSNIYSFPVRLPGETEPSDYTSITFGENWGAFIEGEPFVKEDPKAKEERNMEFLRKNRDMVRRLS
jgi:hypothetical protein